VQLYVRQDGGAANGGKPYLVYGLEMVFIKQIDWTVSSGDEQVSERVTFAYGAWPSATTRSGLTEHSNRL
jgi:hypothetical protein